MTTELLILEYRDKEKGKKEIILRRRNIREKEFEKIQRSITRKTDIETYAHESVLGIKFVLCNPIFGEMANRR